jgi:APA family basic amino acid/polyamine antiporter
VSGAQLRRELGLLDAVGIGLGAIVGAGIFVVTGVAAGVAGPSFIVGLVIAAIGATANALSSAELAAQYPLSGGTYEYGRRLLHPAAGFAAGWLFLASKLAAAGTVALGLGSYLAVLAPSVHPRIVAVGAIALFTLLNYFGIRRTSRANLAIVAVSITTLVVFAIVAASAFDPAHLRPFAPFGWKGTLEAAALLFFAYTGYARIATLGEEVHDPRRTIPRAVMVTIAVAAALYFAVALTAAGSVGSGVLSSGQAPLSAAAAKLGHPMIARIVAAGAVAAMFGVILSQILGLSRMVFAMSRGGDLPTALSVVDPDHGVPRRAVIAIGLVAAVIAGTGTLSGVAAAASFTILIYYAIANLAALRLTKEARLFHPIVPSIGLFFCVGLALSLRLPVILAGLLTLAVGFLIRALFRSGR